MNSHEFVKSSAFLDNYFISSPLCSVLEHLLCCSYSQLMTFRKENQWSQPEESFHTTPVRHPRPRASPNLPSSLPLPCSPGAGTVELLMLVLKGTADSSGLSLLLHRQLLSCSWVITSINHTHHFSFIKKTALSTPCPPHQLLFILLLLWKRYLPIPFLSFSLEPSPIWPCHPNCSCSGTRPSHC